MTENNIPMRDAFGKTLLETGSKYKDLIVLDADVSSSTKTALFGAKYPDRFFNVGVAEANMVDIAAGLATCGLKPLASSFAVFLTTKCLDQIRNIICYGNLNVILAGGFAGISDSLDGASHQCPCDIAILRSLPNMKIIVPADNVEMVRALKSAMNIEGPVYIRICRNATPVIFDEEEPFEFGKIRKLREGSDITIASSGVTLSMALKAADKLEEMGISSEVLNVSTIKPLDEETLIESVRKTGRLLTVEEHSLTGGLGSAVSEQLTNKIRYKIAKIGIDDVFTESGPYNSLMKKYGLSEENIIRKTLDLIKMK